MPHLHLHPLIVHFPIALFITALGAEILSLIFKKNTLHKVAYCNYFFGILGAITAVLSAWRDNMFLKHPVFYTHRNLAYITLIVASISGAILLLIKRKSPKALRILFFFSLLTVVTLVSITAFYGGKLVYEYGVGVEE
ncbi:MAG: DUF2231 domain-containing protein [Candidatus Omnitrophota bacterium]